MNACPPLTTAGVAVVGVLVHATHCLPSSIAPLHRYGHSPVVSTLGQKTSVVVEAPANFDGPRIATNPIAEVAIKSPPHIAAF